MVAVECELDRHAHLTRHALAILDRWLELPLLHCVERSRSPWFFGRFGFVLENVQPVDFIPVRGALGFFDWRKNVTELLL